MEASREPRPRISRSSGQRMAEYKQALERNNRRTPNSSLCPKHHGENESHSTPEKDADIGGSSPQTFRLNFLAMVAETEFYRSIFAGKTCSKRRIRG